MTFFSLSNPSHCQFCPYLIYFKGGDIGLILTLNHHSKLFFPFPFQLSKWFSNIYFQSSFVCSCDFVIVCVDFSSLYGVFFYFPLQHGVYLIQVERVSLINYKSTQSLWYRQRCKFESILFLIFEYSHICMYMYIVILCY